MARRTEVVLEAGVNHKGSLDNALRMVDEAVRVGADAIKFQTYKCERLLKPGHPDWDMLKSCELSEADFAKVAIHCESVGIEFMSTPGDVESLDFLVCDLSVKRIKIGSDDLTFKPLLHKAINSGRQVIISTGMSTLTDIGKALPTNYQGRVTLLHCVSLYPCPPEHANLRALSKLKWFGCPIGYSDHVPGFDASIAAVALGAQLIEKHVMLDEQTDVPDASVSLTFDQAADMIRRIKCVDSMLGTGEKDLNQADMPMRARFRKGSDGLRGLE